MTTRQREILNFIEDYWSENWTAPTLADIAGGVGLSAKSTVFAAVNVMERYGYLERKRLSSQRVLYRVARESYDGRSREGLREFWAHREEVRARFSPQVPA